MEPAAAVKTPPLGRGNLEAIRHVGPSTIVSHRPGCYRHFRDQRGWRWVRQDPRIRLVHPEIRGTWPPRAPPARARRSRWSGP
jgi:hypothetical protein